MKRVDRYDHEWLTSRGCALDVLAEPTCFELSLCGPQIFVGPSDSVVLLPLWAKSICRQKIESIGLTLPWVTVLFNETLTAFATSYPSQYLIPDFGEFGLDHFVNPY